MARKAQYTGLLVTPLPPRPPLPRLGTKEFYTDEAASLQWQVMQLTRIALLARALGVDIDRPANGDFWRDLAFALAREHVGAFKENRGGRPRTRHEPRAVEARGILFQAVNERCVKGGSVSAALNYLHRNRKTLPAYYKDKAASLRSLSSDYYLAKTEANRGERVRQYIKANSSILTEERMVEIANVVVEKFSNRSSHLAALLDD